MFLIIEQRAQPPISSGAAETREFGTQPACARSPCDRVMEEVMLSWALIFFVIAIIAAIFGFGGIASAAAGFAQILFFLFVVLFVVSLIMGLARRG
jgi:uncharacterized membrane protein YtjA (UPF0391 family)